MSTQNVNVGITANTSGLSQLSVALASVQASLANLQSTLASVSGSASQASSSVSQAASNISQSAAAANSAGSSFGNLVGQLKAALGAYLSFSAVRGLMNLSDQAAMLSMRLEGVVGSSEAAKEAQEELYIMSQRLQAGYRESADTFARIMPAVKELGGGVQHATRLTEILITTARMSGSSAASASASALQFAQALGSGVLQGDELRSILENNNSLARMLAESMGVTIGQLRKLGSEGKLTSDMVADSLLGNYDKIKAQSADLPATMEGAFTRIENAFVKMWGQINSGVGVFGYLAEILNALVDVIEDVAEMFSVLGSKSDAIGENNGARLFAEKFAKAIKEMVYFVSSVIIGLVTIIEAAGASMAYAFEWSAQAIDAVLMWLHGQVSRFAEAAKRLMQLDLSGAVAAWRNGGAQIERDLSSRWASMKNIAKTGLQDIAKIMEEGGRKINATHGALFGKDVEKKGFEGDLSKLKGAAAPAASKADKGASREASAISKAEQDYAKAQMDYSLNLYKESMRQEEAELKRSLDQRSITNEEYFAKLSALRDDQIATEIRFKEAEMATIREAMDKKGVKLSERIKLQTQELKLSGEIATLEMKRAETQREFAEQARKAAEQIDRQRQSLRDQIASVSGIGILESKMAAIARKFAELPKELMDSAEARTLQTLETMKARLEEFDRKQKETSELEKAKLDAMKAQGQTTEEGAKQKLLKLERDLLAAKIKNLEAELATARAAGDPVRIQMLEKEIGMLNLRAVAIREGAAEVAQVTNAMQRGFESFFTDMMNGTKSAKDAFKDLANSIVAEINSIIAKKLSNQLMESLFGGGEGGGGFNLGGMLQNLFGGVGGSSGASGGGGFSMGGLFSSIGGGLSSMFSGVGSMFSGLFGGFAGGGYAMSGQPYLVGENGPELFIPGASGSVMPNESMGGLGGVTVHQTINTPDANSFRRASAQVMTDYQRALGRASRRNG